MVKKCCLCFLGLLGIFCFALVWLLFCFYFLFVWQLIVLWAVLNGTVSFFFPSSFTQCILRSEGYLIISSEQQKFPYICVLYQHWERFYFHFIIWKTPKSWNHKATNKIIQTYDYQGVLPTYTFPNINPYIPILFWH